MEPLTWVLWLFSILCFFVYFLKQKCSGKLPPGPKGYPIVGVLPCYDFRDIETYRKLRNQYGNIYSLRLGLQSAIVICGYNMLREVFVVHGEATSDRPKNYLMKELAEDAGE